MTNRRTKVLFRDLKKIYPVVDRAEGIYLYDSEGKRYIDGSGGAIVVHIGHGVKEVLDRIFEQAKKICFAHTSQFTNEAQEKLADKIVEWAPEGFAGVAFTLGGSESNEIAIRLARAYHVETGNPSKYKVIARWQSYHGTTLATLSLSGKPAWRRNWEPLLLNFPHILPVYCFRCSYGLEYDSCNIRCAYGLEETIKFEGPDTIAAFIAEPISGGALGAVVPPPEYFHIIKEICDKYNVLFISEEIMTGFGRTGKNFGIDHWGIIPDIITTAKGISSGYVPLGAAIFHEKIFSAIENGSGKFFPGITFAGTPISCIAGLANLEYIEKNNLVVQSREMGNKLREKLADLEELPIVGDVRGKGLFIGIEFVAEKQTKMPFKQEANMAKRITKTLFDKGLIVLPGSGSVDGTLGDHILLAPPFVIDDSDIDEITRILKECFIEAERFGNQ
jgi:adenosylmethionine-8-amino-7-oxononanoate aminotransferase